MDGLEFCLAIKHGRSLHPVPPLLLTSLLAPAEVLSALETGTGCYVPNAYQGDSQPQSMNTLIQAACEGVEATTGTTGTAVNNEVALQIAASLKQMEKLLLVTYEIAVQQWVTYAGQTREESYGYG